VTPISGISVIACAGAGTWLTPANENRSLNKNEPSRFEQESFPASAKQTEMRLRISVCICTHNGWPRLEEVLEGLKRQEGDLEEWELIVVDNASTDGTGPKTAEYLSRSFAGIGRVVLEPVLGTSFARRRAAFEARSEILCYLDDDTPPRIDFLRNAVRAFERFPKAGAVGGKILPIWDLPPTKLAEAAAPFALAICDRGEKPFRYEGVTSGPVTAGMCARTKVLQTIYGDARFVNRVSGAVGQNPLRGEDTAIVVRTHQLGYECWYDPALVVDHHLSVRRLQKDYLLHLYSGIGRGQAAVRRLFDWKARTPLAWILAAKDFVRWTKINKLALKPEKSVEEKALLIDLRQLQESLLWGRACQALRFWR
jgi:glycosyltransferase involved in cell wall biosynthesis